MRQRLRLAMLGLVLAAAAAGGAGCRSASSYFKEGVQHYDAKRYNEAVNSFNLSINRDSRSDVAYLRRGDAYLELGKLDRALDDYDQAVAMTEARKKPNPWFLNRRGLAHYRAKSYDKALKDWREAKRLEEQLASKGVEARGPSSEVRDKILPEVERLIGAAPVNSTATAQAEAKKTAAAGAAEGRAVADKAPPKAPAPPPPPPPPVVVVPVPAPAPVPMPAPPPAPPPPPRPKRAANLGGTWARAADGSLFVFADDGRRAVASMVASPDFAYYEVCAEWRDERTLEGFAILKESISPCGFEARVPWRLELVGADRLRLRSEAVDWDDETCKEIAREPIEHEFTRVQKAPAPAPEKAAPDKPSEEPPGARRPKRPR